MIEEIHVFDFDGTMVLTPEKPQGWKGGWWGKNHSLLPPFMPHHSQLKESGQHFLNPKVVEAFLESKKLSHVHTVMMTGRHWGLSKDVMNILRAFELCTEEDHRSITQYKREDSKHFVFISGGKTLEGKLDRINELVLEFPEVRKIRIWEDRQEHIPAFRAHIHHLRKLRPDFISVTVHEPPDWD